jgi:hypothetical protein
MCNNELMFKAWENHSCRYGFISPVFSQGKEQYRRMVSAIPSEVIRKKLDTELRIELINGSVIEYLSGDNPHSLRGKTLNGVVIDELRDQDPRLWEMVIRPMLTTTTGWAAFVSTPNGFDALYDLAEQAKLCTDGTWQFFHAPSTDNPSFSMQEFEAAKQSMSEAVFAQEILAEFRDISAGRAYISNGTWNHKDRSPFTAEGLLSPHLPIIVGMDFNVGHMRWTLGQKKGPSWYWHDQIILNESNTPEATRALIEKTKGHKAGLVLIGDATGNARKTASAGETDYTIIRQMLTAAGIRHENRTPDVNPSVKDRVNTVNRKLKAADGSTTMWYHPVQCRDLRRDLERVVWKTSADSAILDQTADSSLTHSSDSIGYPIMALDEEAHPRAGVTRVITRS